MNEDKQNIPEYFIDGPPWEFRDSIGSFFAIVETVKGMFLFPELFFTMMKRKGGLIDAFSFSILLQVVSTLVLAGMSKLFGLGFEVIPQEMIDEGMLSEISSQMLIIFFPLGMFLQIILFSLSFYFAIRIIGNDEYRASTLVRIYAYSSGASSVWNILPGFGSMLAFFFTFRFLFTGLKVLYGEGTSWLVKTVLISIVVMPFLIVAVSLPLAGILLVFGT
jgi:hypothetical protein